MAEIRLRWLGKQSVRACFLEMGEYSQLVKFLQVHDWRVHARDQPAQLCC